MKIYKKILMTLFMVFVALLFNKVYAAAGVTINVDKSEVEVGSTFTVTITGTGAATYDIKASVSGAGISDTINLNAYTDDLSNGTKKASKTYTAKQKGTVNISIKSGSNVTVAGGKKSQSITGSGKTVNIIDKKVTQTQPTQQQTTQQQTNNNKTTTTNKTTSTNKTTTKKTETKTPVVETKEKEEATLQLGIYSLKLIGVRENGEEIEVNLDKEFNINTPDYTCTVANDIKTVRIEKEAYEYNDLVQVSGLEEELKVGENDITLKLAKDDKEISYHIKITKEEPKKEEVQEVSAVVEEPKEKETIIVSIPLIWFMVLEIVIIGVSVGITIVVMMYVKQADFTKADNSKEEKSSEKEFKKI